MRRRRPVMRLAAGAATATVAYKAGERRSEQNQVNDQPQAAYAATQPAAAPEPAPAAAPAPAADDTTAELERLAGLHQSGVLTDEEFTAAKSKILGI